MNYPTFTTLDLPPVPMAALDESDDSAALAYCIALERHLDWPCHRGDIRGVLDLLRVFIEERSVTADHARAAKRLGFVLPATPALILKSDAGVTILPIPTMTSVTWERRPPVDHWEVTYLGGRVISWDATSENYALLAAMARGYGVPVLVRHAP